MKHNSLSFICWFIMACGLYPLSAQQKNLLTIPDPGKMSMHSSDSALPSNAEVALPETPNIYWLTTLPKDYSGLSRLPKARPDMKVSLQREGTTYSGVISLHSKTNVSFFNRIKVLEKETGKRILPVHYSDNYITLMPGDHCTITINFTTSLSADRIQVVADSWTADRLVATAD